MGRLHSKGKGISSSALPYSRTPPSWFKASTEQVVEQICKLAKKGATPSQIGVVLRDSHGVAQVKTVTGNKILRILKSNGYGLIDGQRYDIFCTEVKKKKENEVETYPESFSTLYRHGHSQTYSQSQSQQSRRSLPPTISTPHTHNMSIKLEGTRSKTSTPTRRNAVGCLAPELPEDLYHLIKKAVAVRKHLERNRKDKDSKFRLILIESRIHRLSRYYKSVGVLPPTWRYESATASTLVA
ncbi:hypothetical protein CBS115989_5791 [Aspergillus niger]|nr:hypothetical protein CBS115989_5791 [Aspergillus niger]KAI2853918.1 hypothetical protein CBS11232_5230 [Aspergillus niger]KAI2874876.1 hypothetical protein CBS115988_5894 [Aspergillus niger]KAI2898283.1 hypothetical protein CBS11852_3657 [Aspergillus niger]